MKAKSDFKCKAKSRSDHGSGNIEHFARTFATVYTSVFREESARGNLGVVPVVVASLLWRTQKFRNTVRI